MSIKFLTEGFVPKECCDPISMLGVAAAAGGTGAAGLGTLGTIASIGSTVFGAISSIQQGAAQKSAANYNAKVAERNAAIVEQQTQAQKETKQRETRLRQGANIARGGASGVGLDSFGDVLADTAMQEELDLLTIESEGLLRKQNFEMEAAQQKASGKAAMTQGIMGAGASLLSGASGFIGKSSAPKLSNKSINLASKGGLY